MIMLMQPRLSVMGCLKIYIKMSNDLSCIITNRCSDFEQVLVNSDDQVTVRELLKKHVPIDLQVKITQLFNQEYAKRQAVRNGF
jgi:hypothetical protein